MLSPIVREELIDLCDAVSPRLKWRFIHIPRTGGTAFRATYGLGIVKGHTAHAPASWFEDAEYLFTIVRNPFDRAVSLCAYLYGWQQLDVQTFRTWVSRGCPSQTHASIGAGISEPQVHWIDDRVTTVTYERLDEELPAVLQHIGEDVRPMRRMNASRRDADWRRYYHDESLRAVRQIYAADFELGPWTMHSD